MSGRFASLINKLSPRVILRALLTVILVSSFLLYPWHASGPVAFDSSDPRLVSVSPTLGGGAVFDQRDRQVNVLGNLSGAPRLDFVSSESSFVFQTDAEVLAQTVSPSSDWNWVSVNTPHPWNAPYFTITIEAGRGTFIDVAAVKVTDASDKTSVVFQTDFPTQSNNGWAFTNNASFIVSGSPPLPSIHLISGSGGLQSAYTSSGLPISASITRVFVSAFVRFEQGAGPFRVAVKWLAASGVLISDAAEWGTWSSYFAVPASLTVQIWHPDIQEQARLRFKTLDSFSGQIFFELFTFRTGLVDYNESVAPYHLGERFRISAAWDRSRSVSFSVSNDSGLTFNWSSLNSLTSPGLEEIVHHTPLAVSVLPQGAGLTADVALYSPVYVFPGNGRFGDLAANMVPLLVSLLDLGLLVILWLPEEAGLIGRLYRNLRMFTDYRLCPAFRRHLIALTFLTFASILYYVIASQYGGHPFDNAVFKTWLYSGQLDGLQGVYARSSSVGDSFVRGDNAPWSSLGFSYLPFAAYLMILFSKVIPSIVIFPSQYALFGSSSLEASVKWLLSTFTLLAGALIYWTVRRWTGSERRALLAMTILVLNPAIIFDSVIWGETDSILYFAFVAFALAAYKRPALATALFLFALGVKQTGIFLIFPTALILMNPSWSFSKRMATAGKAAAVFFAAIVPLLVGGVLPSALFKSLVTKLGDIGGSAGVASLVSADTYTVWTLFTSLTGNSGEQVLLFPANVPVLGWLTFSLLGYISFGLLMSVVCILARRRAQRPGPAFWYGMVAFVSIAFTALITGAGSRYYTLAIPVMTTALALGWNEISQKLRVAAVYVLVSISAISLWTMSGLFTLIMSREFPDIRHLEPAQNSLMAFVGKFYLLPYIVIIGSAIIILALMLCTKLLLALASQQRPAILP
jgi:hypothetical protein